MSPVPNRPGSGCTDLAALCFDCPPCLPWTHLAAASSFRASSRTGSTSDFNWTRLSSAAFSSSPTCWPPPRRLGAAALARRFGLINTMVFTHLPSNVLLLLVPLMPSAQLAVALLVVRFCNLADGCSHTSVVHHGRGSSRRTIGRGGHHHGRPIGGIGHLAGARGLLPGKSGLDQRAVFHRRRREDRVRRLPVSVIRLAQAERRLGRSTHHHSACARQRFRAASNPRTRAPRRGSPGRDRGGTPAPRRPRAQAPMRVSSIRRSTFRRRPFPRARSLDDSSRASITTPLSSRSHTRPQVTGLSNRSSATTFFPTATATPVAPSTYLSRSRNSSETIRIDFERVGHRRGGRRGIERRHLPARLHSRRPTGRRCSRVLPSSRVGRLLEDVPQLRRRVRVARGKLFRPVPPAACFDAAHRDRRLAMSGDQNRGVQDAVLLGAAQFLAFEKQDAESPLVGDQQIREPSPPRSPLRRRPIPRGSPHPTGDNRHGRRRARTRERRRGIRDGWDRQHGLRVRWT